MTKISRVDLSKLTDNSDLIDNNDEERFSVSDMLSKMNDEESVDLDSLVRGHFPSTMDVSVSINTNTSQDEEVALEGDFGATRDINKFHIQILMESMKSAYAQYRKTGDPKDLQQVISVSYALESAKKGLLSAHKDITKVKLDKSRINKNSSGVGGARTINIQNNTFTGTPNDVLNEYGNAIDLKDWGNNDTDEEESS